MNFRTGGTIQRSPVKKNKGGGGGGRGEGHEYSARQPTTAFYWKADEGVIASVIQNTEKSISKY